ncbi:MAG: carboxypeptidase-like regulatory domain-containing protein, partial [Acidobacteriota bacterium]|nr:carboxypeptidase-like regulatory domain-containing protein [Acidobacteriota bacterium]
MRSIFKTPPIRLYSRLGVLLPMLLMIGLYAPSGLAQVLYGTVVGNVKDESGAVINGATITATNTETGLAREVTTNDNGDYTIQNVLPGNYDVKIVRTGFATFTTTAVPVTTNFVARVDAQMKVGGLSDVVTVASDATLLQTDSAEVKSELSSREINTLPLNQYRNYQALLDLVPGTTPAQFQNSIVDTPGRALTTNVNGTPRNINSTRTDGAANVNVWLPHHTAYVPPAETIQEVTIVTSNFDAEQGLAGGAAITVLTKSGTNELHGSAFGYHTNQRFRARPFFLPGNREKPVGNLDIFGGTVGGPILKDKLFFFGGYERTRDRSAFDALYTVPTLAERAGDFSAFRDAQGNPIRIFDTASGAVGSRTEFANAIIPANRFSPAAQRLINLIPLPNVPSANANSNYFNAATRRMIRDNYDLKINWNRNASHQIWGKYSRMDAIVTGYPGLGAAGGPHLGGAAGTGDT